MCEVRRASMTKWTLLKWMCRNPTVDAILCSAAGNCKSRCAFRTHIFRSCIVVCIYRNVRSVTTVYLDFEYAHTMNTYKKVYKKMEKHLPNLFSMKPRKKVNQNNKVVEVSRPSLSDQTIFMCSKIWWVLP